MKRQRTDSGFTLIELMITIALLAILTTIAYPSYQKIIAKGNRNLVRSTLLEFSASQEQHKLENRGYATHFGSLKKLPASTATSLYLGKGGTRSASVAADSLFKIEFSDESTTCGAANPASFKATAVGKQASLDEKCTTYIVCYTGRKQALDDTGSSSADIMKQCWG